MSLHREIADLLTDRGLLIANLYGDGEAAGRWLGQAEERAELLVLRLSADDGDQEVAAAALTTLCWGDAEPPGSWWGTALGQAVARARGDEDAVTPTHAAIMLAVTPTRVHQLRTAGQLVAHPDGGVTLSSVLGRIEQVGRPACWTVPRLLDGDGDQLGPLDADTIAAVREEIAVGASDAPAVCTNAADAPILIVDAHGRPLTVAAAVALIDHIAAER